MLPVIGLFFVILIKGSSCEELISFKTNESVAIFAKEEKCFSEKKEILTCYAEYFKQIGSGEVVKDSLPKYEILREFILMKRDMCREFTQLVTCLDPSKNCLNRPIFCALLSNDHDGDMYIRHLAATRLQCEKPELYEKFIDCSYKLSTSNDTTMRELANCGSNMDECKDVISTTSCEMKVFKDICGDVQPICEFQQFQLPLMGSFDVNCMRELYAQCTSMNEGNRNEIFGTKDSNVASAIVSWILTIVISS